MPNPQVSARVPDEVVSRLQVVREALNERRVEGDPELDQGDVVRRALLLGLRAIEAELGIDAPRKGGKKTPRKA